MLKVKFRYLLSLLLFCFIQCAHAGDTDKTAVQNAYADWCSAISEAKGDPGVVVKYYAPDALLLPTFYPKILINQHGGLNAYFKELTSQPNIKCVPQKLITRLYGDIAINTGIYDFTYTEKDGKTQTVNARFTFVYKLYDKKWMIINHHSSLRPVK